MNFTIYILHKNRFFKGLSLLLILSLCFSTFSWGDDISGECVYGDNVQVQSLIERITSPEYVDETEFMRLEMKMLLQILGKYREKPYFSFNAILDEWYAALPYSAGGRFLDVFLNPDGDLSVRVFRGEDRGKILGVYDNSDGKFINEVRDSGFIGKNIKEVRINKRKLILSAKVGKQTRETSIIPGEYVDIDQVSEWVNKNSEKECRSLLKDIFDLLRNNPPQLFTFQGYEKDVLAYASNTHNIIVCHQALAHDPLAVFHELCEFLVKERKIKFRIKTQSKKLIIECKGKVYQFDVRESLGSLIKDGEKWAGARAKKLNTEGGVHYLIRILQREMFAEKDSVLSSKIKTIRTDSNTVRKKITWKDRWSRNFIWRGYGKTP